MMSICSSSSKIADLNSVYFKPSPESELIPFSTVAALEAKWETMSIYRRDGQRTISILGYAQFGLTPAQVSQRFTPKLEVLADGLPATYRLELGGENEQRRVDMVVGVSYEDDLDKVRSTIEELIAADERAIVERAGRWAANIAGPGSSAAADSQQD